MPANRCGSYFRGVILNDLEEARAMATGLVGAGVAYADGCTRGDLESREMKDGGHRSQFRPFVRKLGNGSST